MSRESEKLLQVIGTDAEYGTHGAMPWHMVLACSVQAGRDIYHQFKGLRLEKEVYRRVMEETIPLFNQMSQPAFVRLLQFAEKVGFVNRDFGEKIKKSYVLPAWCEEQVGKRARFLQAFSGVRPQIFTLGELKEEKEVKAKYPWQWIDTVGESSPELARKEVVNQLIASPDLRPFYLRVSSMADHRGYLEAVLKDIKGKVPVGRYADIRRRVVAKSG